MIKILPKGSQVLLAFGGDMLGLFDNVRIIETTTEIDVIVHKHSERIFWGSSDKEKKKYTCAYRVNSAKLSVYFKNEDLR